MPFKGVLHGSLSSTEIPCPPSVGQPTEAGVPLGVAGDSPPSAAPEPRRAGPARGRPGGKGSWLRLFAPPGRRQCWSTNAAALRRVGNKLSSNQKSSLSPAFAAGPGSGERPEAGFPPPAAGGRWVRPGSARAPEGWVRARLLGQAPNGRLWPTPAPRPEPRGRGGRRSAREEPRGPERSPGLRPRPPHRPGPRGELCRPQPGAGGAREARPGRRTFPFPASPPSPSSPFQEAPY